MPRCGQFAEDRTEPSAGLMGLRGPHLPASRSATDEVGDTARADNWRNPEGVSALGHLSASLLSHSPFLGMLLRPSADVRLRDLTRDRAEFFNSLLEPVKKLQSAALLLDFWLGQGVRAVAIPAACCRCFASPCGLPSAGCLPRSAVAPGQRRPSQKDTQPYGRRFLIFSQVLKAASSFFLMQPRQNRTTFGHDRDHCRRPGGLNRAASRWGNAGI